MKLINLNKFRTVNQVQIGEEVFDIYGIPVGDVIDNDPIEAIDQLTNPVDRVKEIIKVLCKYSNIPAETLKAQPFGVLMALIYVVQGIDPDQQKEPAEKKDATPGK